MKENGLRPPKGAKHARKRIGCGTGSGHGTYACRGIKGQNARGGVHPLFEGGQNPLVKRLPYKRGFNNIFRTEYTVINIEALNVFPEGTEVGPEQLVSAGTIKNLHNPVKVLGGGKLAHKITVKANKFSKSAKSKIEAAGGMAEVIA